jgi:hypothetical protein
MVFNATFNNISVIRGGFQFFPPPPPHKLYKIEKKMLASSILFIPFLEMKHELSFHLKIA